VDDYLAHYWLYDAMGYKQIEANVTEPLCGISCSLEGSSIPGDNWRSKKAIKGSRDYIYQYEYCSEIISPTSAL
jgi:hypothetical protein